MKEMSFFKVVNINIPVIDKKITPELLTDIIVIVKTTDDKVEVGFNNKDIKIYVKLNNKNSSNNLLDEWTETYLSYEFVSVNIRFFVKYM